jgi:hypothetical protein
MLISSGKTRQYARMGRKVRALPGECECEKG